MFRDINRRLQGLLGFGVFGSEIDVPTSRTDTETSNGHPFDELKRIRLHDQSIGKGTRVTLVCVTDNVFLCGMCIENCLPFDARWECSPTASAQA